MRLRSRRPKSIPTRSALALVLGAALLGGCAEPLQEPLRAERAILERQVGELERLVERGQRGPLVPFRQGLLAVDQSLIQELLTVALPYETVVGGQFRIRILEATVTCQDGLPFVHLRGRASFANQPEESSFVEADVFGSLLRFDLERDANLLRGRVDVIAFETRGVKLGGEDNDAVKGLLGDLAGLNLEVFKEFDYSFDIPVRLMQKVIIPELGGPGHFSISEAEIPLQVSVTDVTAIRGKLWITIDLYDELRPAAGAQPTVAASGARAR